MKIKIIQNTVGNFNFADPSQESLVFSAGLFDNNQMVEKDGFKCKIYFCSKEGHLQQQSEELDHLFNNLEIGEIFNLCLDYCSGIWSSEPHKENAIAFWKVFQENKEEILQNFISNQKEDLERQIKDIQKKLSRLEDSEFDESNYDKCIKRRINLYEKWIKGYKDELEQIKEGSAKFEEISLRIKKYEEQILSLKSLLGFSEFANEGND